MRRPPALHGTLPGSPILDRHRIAPMEIALPDDFDLGGAPPVVSAVPPGWSIYCLDPDRRAWMLVDVAPGPLLEEAVFAHLEQYRAARRVALLPWGAPATCNAVETLPVFSVGRCGSTLLIRLLRAAGLRVASEFDGYTAIGTARGARPNDGGTERDLAQRAAELTASLALPPHRPPLVLKFRSQACEGAGPIVSGCAAGRAVFVTRRIDGWARSLVRTFPGQHPDEIARQLRRALLGMAEAARAGCEIELVTYDALLRDPAALLRRLVGRTLGRAEIDAVLGKDSQHGTPIGAATPRDEAPEAWIEAFDLAWSRHRPDPELRRLGLTRDLVPVAERAHGDGRAPLVASMTVGRLNRDRT